MTGSVREHELKAPLQLVNHGAPRRTGLGKPVQEHEPLLAGPGPVAYITQGQLPRAGRSVRLYAGCDQVLWRPRLRRWVLCLIVNCFRRPIVRFRTGWSRTGWSWAGWSWASWSWVVMRHRVILAQ